MKHAHVIAAVAVLGLVGGGAVLALRSRSTPNSRGEGAKPLGRSESPYRQCVRDLMANSFAEVKARGLQPNGKSIESTAVFSCQATFHCYTEEECDRVMREQDEEERSTMERWK